MIKQAPKEFLWELFVLSESDFQVNGFMFSIEKIKDAEYDAIFLCHEFCNSLNGFR